MTESTKGNRFAIQTFGISKKFGNIVAVDGLDLSVEEGELFSLLGPNGAGKTTTIKMLCCLLRPSSGTATIMGHDIQKDPIAVKKVIDVSPQETAIAEHLNAWENLSLIGGIHGFEKEEVKKRLFSNLTRPPKTEPVAAYRLHSLLIPHPPPGHGGRRPIPVLRPAFFRALSGLFWPDIGF